MVRTGNMLALTIFFKEKMQIFKLEYFKIRKMFLYLHCQTKLKHKRYGKRTCTQNYERGRKACSSW